jgi:hypothetical protein
VTAAQCQSCHEKGGCPTMKPDYAFDFEKAKGIDKGAARTRPAEEG